MNLEESKGLELALTHVCILSKRWGTSSVMMVSKRLAIVITYQLYITIAYLLTSVYCCTTFLNQNSMYWQIPSNKEIWHEPLNPPFVEYMNEHSQRILGSEILRIQQQKFNSSYRFLQFFRNWWYHAGTGAKC